MTRLSNPIARARSWACLLAIGATGVAAESVTYRFEAELRQVRITPPAGSTSARAASAERITGSFGYRTDARPAATARVPGRVAFGDYDTGFISFDQVDTGGLAGPVALQVTDGIPRSDDPRATIRDELTIAHRAVSTEAPIDSASLRFLYEDADRLQDLAIPARLEFADFASIALTFSTRVDAVGDRGAQGADRIQVLGLVQFEVTRIERVD